MNTAGFYHIKTFEGYSFDGIQFPHDLTPEDVIQADFIRKKENLILYGNVGAGKTHLATAIGVQARAKGYRVDFFKTAALVNLLNEKKKEGALSLFMKKLNKTDSLICDE